jgi:SSS family solute:Na+ symporter
MNLTYIIVIVAYLVVSTLVAFLYGARKNKSEVDYSVGGRSFGTVLLFFTMLATIVGASSVMGASNWFYVRGLTQIWYTVGCSAAYLIYMFYLAPRISAFGKSNNGQTIGDWMEYRYGKPAKYVSSILIILAYVAITAFQYLAMATILSFVTGMTQQLSLIITAVIVIVYTSFGGLWAVASTDVLQGAMTLIGVIVMTPILVGKAGGIGEIFAAAPAEHLQLFGYVTPTGAIAAILAFGLGIISWPDVWQRCYAAKDNKALKKSFVYFLIASVLITVLMLFVGFAGRTLLPGYEGESNLMLPSLVAQYLPSALGAVIFASLIAVIMGTADSTLLVSSVMLDRDLIAPMMNRFGKKTYTEKQKVNRSRIITAICGFAVLIVLFFSTDMFDLWVKSAEITGASLAVPILFGFAWKKPSGKAAMVSILLGFGGWLLPQLGLLETDALLLGAGLSLVGYLVVGLLEKKSNLPAAASEK